MKLKLIPLPRLPGLFEMSMRKTHAGHKSSLVSAKRTALQSRTQSDSVLGEFIIRLEVWCLCSFRIIHSLCVCVVCLRAQNTRNMHLCLCICPTSGYIDKYCSQPRVGFCCTDNKQQPTRPIRYRHKPASKREMLTHTCAYSLHNPLGQQHSAPTHKHTKVPVLRRELPSSHKSRG